MERDWDQGPAETTRPSPSRAGRWVFAGVAFIGLAVSALLTSVTLMLGDRSLAPWLLAAGAIVTLVGAGAAAWVFGEWERRRREAAAAAETAPIFLPVPVASTKMSDDGTTALMAHALDDERARAVEARGALDRHLSEGAERTARLLERLVEVSRLRDESRASQRVADDAARNIVDRTAQARSTAKFIETQAASAGRAVARMNDTLDRLRWVGRDSEPILDDVRELAHTASALAVSASIEAARGGEAAPALHALSDELREWARSAKDAVRTTHDVLRESDQLFGEGEQAAQNLRSRLEDFATGIGMVNRLFEDIPAAQREYARLSEPVLRADRRADDVLRDALEAARAEAADLTRELEAGSGRPLIADARVESDDPKKPAADAVARATPKRIGTVDDDHTDPAEFLPLDDADDGTRSE